MNNVSLTESETEFLLIALNELLSSGLEYDEVAQYNNIFTKLTGIEGEEQ